MIRRSAEQTMGELKYLLRNQGNIFLKIETWLDDETKEEKESYQLFIGQNSISPFDRNPKSWQTKPCEDIEECIAIAYEADLDDEIPGSN